MYLGCQRREETHFSKRLERCGFFVDDNLSLNYKITTLHEKECQLLYLIVAPLFFFLQILFSKTFVKLYTFAISFC